MKIPGKDDWQKAVIYLLISVAILLAMILIAGCSAASVTEYYERTPTHAVSVGEGGMDVVTTQPFRVEDADVRRPKEETEND